MMNLKLLLATFMCFSISLATAQNGGKPDKGTKAPKEKNQTKGKSEQAPGKTGTAPGKAGTTPSQTGTTPGKSGTTPGKSGTTLGKSASSTSPNPNPEVVNAPPWPIDESKIQTTETGLRYFIYQQGTGSIPQKGDRVTANYHGMLKNGDVFDSSFNRGKPFSFGVGQGQVIRGWDEGFTLFPVGTKAVLFIPPALGYGSRDMGVIPPNSDLIFHVELVDAASSFKGYKLDESKLQTTASGLKYQIVKEGKGQQADAGKNVSVHYHGMLMDGKVFDSSFSRGEPITFPLGQGMVIPGWEEGIALLKEGSQAIFIIPAELGYGEQGAPPVIPGNATLRFDVELMQVQ